MLWSYGVLGNFFVGTDRICLFCMQKLVSKLGDRLPFSKQFSPRQLAVHESVQHFFSLIPVLEYCKTVLGWLLSYCLTNS